MIPHFNLLISRRIFFWTPCTIWRNPLPQSRGLFSSKHGKMYIFQRSTSTSTQVNSIQFQITYVRVTFVQKTFVHTSNISSVPDQIFSKLFGPTLLDARNSFDQNFVTSKLFKPQSFLPKFLFEANIFLDQIFLPKILRTQNFGRPFFSTKFFLNQKVFGPNILLDTCSQQDCCINWNASMILVKRKKRGNKPGLNWAKLSSSLDLALLIVN